jgi:hypothetical protein
MVSVLAWALAIVDDPAKIAALETLAGQTQAAVVNHFMGSEAAHRGWSVEVLRPIPKGAS